MNDVELSDHEPDLTTSPELLPILEELMQREPIFHRPELSTTRADFDGMMSDDFWEVGASGTRYSRKFVLDELERRNSQTRSDVWETREFYCRQLGPDVYLLTYTLLQDRVRKTRRTTVWRRAQNGWKIEFHQGTIVQDARTHPNGH